MSAETAQRTARPFTGTADRTSLFVTGWGSVPPVVFTHAWGLRPDRWTYQVPALASAGLRRVLCDRRGHGRSGRPLDAVARQSGLGAPETLSRVFRRHWRISPGDCRRRF